MILIVIGSVWILDSNILNLLFLGYIKGVIWSNECVNCLLVRLNIFSGFMFSLEGDKDSLFKMFVECGFFLICGSVLKCLLNFCRIIFSFVENVKVINVFKKFFYILYIMGVGVIFFNLIVLMMVFFLRFFC